LGEAQIELEIRRRYAVRALAAHQAELHVELGDTGLLQLHVRRLEHATHGDRARDAGDQQEAGGGESSPATAASPPATECAIDTREMARQAATMAMALRGCKAVWPRGGAAVARAGRRPGRSPSRAWGAVGVASIRAARVPCGRSCPPASTMPRTTTAGAPPSRCPAAATRRRPTPTWSGRGPGSSSPSAT